MHRSTLPVARRARTPLRCGAGYAALLCAAFGACTTPGPAAAPADLPASRTSELAADGATVLRVTTPEGDEVWSESRLKALRSASVTWTHHETSLEYRGVALSELCGDAIAQRSSRDAERKTWNRIVVALGGDGYAALFSAAELRTDWGPTRAFVCWEEGGRPLPPGDGPLRLVVPSDGGGARCVRNLTEVRVVDAGALVQR